MNNKSSIYTLIYITLLLIIFFTIIIFQNSNAILAIFIISSIILIFIFKSIKPLAPFYISLLINNSLVESSIEILKGITLTALIRAYFFLLFLLCLRKYKKINHLVGISFFSTWILYFLINSIINNVSGIIGATFSFAIFMFINVYMDEYVNQKDINKNFFISALIASLVVMLFCGYLEFVLGKTFFYSNWTGAERYRYGILRVGTTASDPNFACLSELFLLAVINIPSLSIYINNKFKIFLNILGLLQIIILTSRTGIIALSCTITILMYKKYKKIIIIISPILMICLVALIKYILKSFITIDFNSYFARTKIISLALQMWKIHPFLGYGSHSFYNASESMLGLRRGTMNEYAAQLVNYGLIGLGFYLTYIILLIKGAGNIKSLITHQINDYVFFFVIIMSWCIMGFSLDTYSKIMIWIFPAIVNLTKKINIENIRR